MGLLGKIVTAGVDSVIDSVSSGLDSLFTSDEERLEMKNKLEQIRNNAKLKQLELAQEQEKQITKRWLSDNEHFITRLVRPLSFASVLVLFGAVVLADGNVGQFKINPSYIPLLENVLITMVFAYFGSRGAEKITKHIKGNNKEGK
jgi:hypothetical protein